MFALWQDVRFAVRTLARTPGFAAAALATLALGIGANAAIFCLVNSLVRQELPVPDPSGLVHVYQTRADRPDDYFPLSLVDYRYYREHAESFEELAAHYPTAPLHLIVGDATEAITGSVVTASYFGLLGISPAAGRFFLDEEDRVPGRDAVAVISHAFWQRRFNAEPRAIGSTISLNGTTFTVVGVAPRGFVGVLVGGASLEVWIPSAMFRVGYRYCDAFQRDCTIVNMLGRLKRDRSVAAAQRELDVLARRLEAAYPAENKGRGLRALPARGSYPAQQAEADRPVKILLVTVGLVLVIACANLAALLLARGMHRRREIAIRLALGANRGQLIRQLLVESLVLSLTGGALGLIVASGLKEYLWSFYGTDYAGRALNFSLDIDRVVLLATLGLSILTGVLFGLVPALQTSRPDVVPVLKDETSAGGLRRSRFRDALIVAQVAASIVLLVGAGLLVRSLATIYHGPGFDPRPVAILRLRPSLVEYDVPKARQFQRRVIERLEALPGVLSASPSDVFPYLGGWGSAAGIWIPSRPPERTEDAFHVATAKIGPSFFKTIGASLVEGREFGEQDGKLAPRVVIVNEALARRFWPDGQVVGETLVVDGEPREVVGVVRLAAYHNLTERPSPYLFLNYWQSETANLWDGDARLHVRVAGDPAAMLGMLRREIAAVDPNVPISEDHPLTLRLEHTFKALRVARAMLTGVGSLAVLLSAIGLYGGLAYNVARRTREIAIRIALGADRVTVAGLVLGQGARLTIAGVAIGLTGAFIASRFLSSLLYGVNPHDRLTFVAVPITLCAVALLASYIPARRAIRVDPMIALRSE
jgi:putative ABC transport system permease protein